MNKNKQTVIIQCQNGIELGCKPSIARMLTDTNNSMLARPLRGSVGVNSIDPFAHLDSKVDTVESSDGDGGLDIEVATKAKRGRKPSAKTDDSVETENNDAVDAVEADPIGMDIGE